MQRLAHHPETLPLPSHQHDSKRRDGQGDQQTIRKHPHFAESELAPQVPQVVSSSISTHAGSLQNPPSRFDQVTRFVTTLPGAGAPVGHRSP